MENKITPPFKFFYSDFINWSKQTEGKHILTFQPKTTQELVVAVNWAYQEKYRVRPLGNMHNWSQLTIANGENNSRVLLIDLKKYLNSMRIEVMGNYGVVTAQTGVSMEALLTKLEKSKLGFLATPAPGDLTLGGVLAIGAHGTGMPATGEERPAGGCYGTLSNSIVSLTAIVWDETAQSYVLKTFQRNDKDISAFMVHIGRALIVEVTLQVPRNKRLRCQSYVNIPASDLFAEQADRKNSFASFVERSGRAEAIWFPFTEEPWLKVWTENPTYNGVSRRVSSPFNYPFSDNLPASLEKLIKNFTTGHPEAAPAVGNAELELVKAGLGTTLSFDLWGWSKDLLLYVKPSTLRVTANGYAILTRRDKMQQVIYDFVQKYREMVALYQTRNSYPMNNAVEIRVTGVDNPDESIVAGAQVAAFSAARRREDRPDWDTVIWLDNLSHPDTPDANVFYQQMEQWIFEHFSGDYAECRVEWSKGWGYTPEGTWENERVINQLIPASLTRGADENNWQSAMDILDKYDPHHLFTSPLLERLSKAGR
ncbi:FAD-binding protein [Paramixta manurensis]|uniref:FAD-binding protein n=2 Tax=Paramixta manurensis TaxID=2740817 RepID=A0A6M8UHU6_9GAMM|nr:FAD-binding protein [Erwiniaceae bacterium PD-1]